MIDPSVAIDEIGIDITQQKIGAILFIEAEDGHLFEIEIVVPEKSIVKVSGTEPRMKYPVLGGLVYSFSSDKKTQLNSWIGKLLKMSLVFKNGNYESAPVLHASVKGAGWQYNVF